MYCPEEAGRFWSNNSAGTCHTMRQARSEKQALARDRVCNHHSEAKGASCSQEQASSAQCQAWQQGR